MNFYLKIGDVKNWTCLISITQKFRYESGMSMCLNSNKFGEVWVFRYLNKSYLESYKICSIPNLMSSLIPKWIVLLLEVTYELMWSSINLALLGAFLFKSYPYALISRNCCFSINFGQIIFQTRQPIKLTSLFTLIQTPTRILLKYGIVFGLALSVSV